MVRYNLKLSEALKCIDHKYNKPCCVKIIKNNKKFISQAKIEIKILKYIRTADCKNEANIVKVYDSFVFRNHIVRLNNYFSV